MRALTRRVPCRARGQLALLNEDDIRPAFERQMVQEAYTHYATTDNNHSGMRFHLVHPLSLKDDYHLKGSPPRPLP
jgi:hypothetical protein